MGKRKYIKRDTIYWESKKLKGKRNDKTADRSGSTEVRQEPAIVGPMTARGLQ